MELLRGVSAANNFVLALVPLLSSQLFNSRSRPDGGVSNAARMQKTDHTHRRLRRVRRERPRGRRAAEKGDELAASHCPMPPVLPTERIAHLGTADCCLHPPGRNEMIAITPPIISSKEVAQKQATPFPRQDLLTARNSFRASFRE